MSGHAYFESMLVCADELTLAERVRLEAHLAGCAACRGLASIYAENRERLRAVAQVRPPEELRAAVLAAAETTRPVVRSIALFLPFAIVPIAPALIWLGLTYGPMAWLGNILGLVACVVATGWYEERRQARARELPLVREPGTGLKDICRAIGWDTLGVIIGVGVIVLIVLGAAHIGGQ